MTLPDPADLGIDLSDLTDELTDDLVITERPVDQLRKATTGREAYQILASHGGSIKLADERWAMVCPKSPTPVICVVAERPHPNGEGMVRACSTPVWRKGRRGEWWVGLIPDWTECPYAIERFK